MPSTLTELKDDIESWMHRSDLTASLDTFVQLAEKRINRLLDVRETEVEAELSMTIGSRYVAFPSDAKYPLKVWMKASLPREELMQTTAQQIESDTAQGVPSYWAVDGANIAFNCPADQAYDFDLRYVQNNELTALAPTNYILTNYPDVYLFGSLVEACTFTGDPNTASMYEGRFQQAIQDAKNNESRATSQVPMRTEIAGLFCRAFGINRG